MILAAMSQTKSNMASARYLNCSLQHYRKWAMLYEATEPGYKSLYHQHKNQSGKGIPKFLRNSKKEPALDKILSGDMNPSSFNPQKLKYRLISEGHLRKEEFMITKCRCFYILKMLTNKIGEKTI